MSFSILSYFDMIAACNITITMNAYLQSIVNGKFSEREKSVLLKTASLVRSILIPCGKKVIVLLQ